MPDEITLYTNAYARGRVARRMLEETGAAYRAEVLDLDGAAKQPGKITLEYAHFVKPELGFGENPHWCVVEYLGEPIVIGMRTLADVTGLNELWRFEMADGKVAKLRLYCFNPDVLAAVAEDLGMPALSRPYRSPG